MRRRWWSMVAVLLLACPAASLALDIDSMPTPELQRRYDALTHELRCMQCQNQSIADSPVGLASDLRREVRELLMAGRSDDEIRAHMVQRYGNFILFRPPFDAHTAWVWVLPFVLLVVGIVVAWNIVRQRSRLVADDDSVIDAEDRR